MQLSPQKSSDLVLPAYIITAGALTLSTNWVGDQPQNWALKWCRMLPAEIAANVHN